MSLNLEKIWKDVQRNLLETGGLSLGEMRLAPTGVEFPEGPALIGVTPEGFRHLLFPLSEDSPVMDDTASRGIQLRTRDYLQGEHSRRFLDVKCPLPALSELFAVVASEMLAAAQEQPEDIVGSVLPVLERWRGLLLPEKQRILGKKELAAILGELLTLERISTPGRDPLPSWVGPDCEPHDFVSESVDIEVKTTLSSEGYRAVIHGLKQLQERGGADLYLQYIRLECHPGGELTVPEVIDRICEGGVSRAGLYEKLQELGYHAIDEVHYRNICFGETEALMYRVEGEFPRLTAAALVEGKLPGAVSKLTYEIDLGSLEEEKLGEKAAGAVYQKFLMEVS